jgi:hypothetical protein
MGKPSFDGILFLLRKLLERESYTLSSKICGFLPLAIFAKDFGLGTILCSSSIISTSPLSFDL